MGDYQLTRKGKLVLGILIVLLSINVGVCLEVLWGYFSASEINESTEPATEPSIESTTIAIISEPPTEPPTEPSTEPTTEPTTEPSPIYTVEILEDLRTSLFEFYFVEKSADLKETYEDQFRDLVEVLKAYPDENVVIEGHVNGYPSFVQTEENLKLSEKRSDVILEQIIGQGIENNRITVYNLGSEVPKIRESANQSENDRVIVYFKDHYNFVNFGK